MSETESDSVGKIAPKVAALPAGTVIGSYVISNVISSGGFSYVYYSEGRDGIPVAIKEYIPSKLSIRDEDLHVQPANEEVSKLFYHGLNCFYEEGRTLSKIRHPNVVQILNFIKENNTVYMVMQYETGHSLHEYIVKRGLLLKEANLRKIILDVLDGLDCVHELGIYHLDIKPSNIYLRRNNAPMLLDFGSVRNSSKTSSTLPPTLTHGFAAPEQYVKNGEIGPWTDIYSIGATMYAAINGRGNPKIPSGKERIAGMDYKRASIAGRARFSEGLLNIIDKCLSIDIKERFQSAKELEIALIALNANSDPVSPSASRNMINKVFNTFL